MTSLHPSAIIDKDASIGEGVTVGAFSVIGPGVVLGDGVNVHPHVVIERDAEIGERCEIFPFASIGAAPLDLLHQHAGVRIGAGTIIRECVIVHPGPGHFVTDIGPDCLLMAYVHVGPGSRLGRSVIMANLSTLADDVTVGDHAFISGMVVVDRTLRIGPHTMLSMLSRIEKDVPPYSIVQGADFTRLYGINRIGLERKGFSPETLQAIERAYALIACKGVLLSEALRRVREDLPHTDEVRAIADFFTTAGVNGVYRSGEGHLEDGE